jgi:hypothetical protein
LQKAAARGLHSWRGGELHGVPRMFGGLTILSHSMEGGGAKVRR